MRLQRIANPYAVFSIAWIIVLSLYSLEWAGIFPEIVSQLYWFIIVLIVICAITSVFYNRVKILSSVSKSIIINYKLLLFINALLWIPNFLYTGVPLLTGLRDSEFGIPTLRTFLTSFNCFLSIYGFYLFLVTGKKSYLLGIPCCFLFFILIISRGNILMSLSSMFFLWMNIKKPTLTFKGAIVIFTGLCLVMYCFGVAGNLRSIKDVESYTPKFESTYSSDIVLQIANASDSFRDSKIPDEFFWSYLYLTSPISNLTYDIKKESPPFTFKNMLAVFVNEITLDAMSKRLDEMFHIKSKKPSLLIAELTVSTAFAGSYTYAGWGGMIFFMILFWTFPIAYIILILNNPLGVIGISILCTVFFFSMFDNMLILSGLTPQLLYPILFKMFNRIKMPAPALRTVS